MNPPSTTELWQLSGPAAGIQKNKHFRISAAGHPSLQLCINIVLLIAMLSLKWFYHLCYVYSSG